MLSATGKSWEIRKRAGSDFFAENSDLPPLMAQLLHNRSYTDREVIQTVLSDSDPPHDPFWLSGMEDAVNRILRAVNDKETVCVYADYDADGVCGAAVLISALQALGARSRHYFPNRVSEGYGLNEEAVRSIRDLGADVLISTDCGANAVQEVDLAADLGLDVIVTDHHEVSEELPRAAAAINPRNPGEPYPFPDLAGVGVAYKLAEALLLETDSTAIDGESLLDFVALGTVADVVPLRGENRLLVREGIKRLNNSPRPGMRALIQAAGLEVGSVTSRDLAFRLGPRLNAAGRMREAGIALDLLLSDEIGVATDQARVLNELNRERQLATESVLDAALHSADDGELILVNGDDWPLGVLGLVAGRLVERTGRPAFVSSAEAGEIRGSARGPEGFDLLQLLRSASSILKKHGGHKRAAGFSLDPERLEEFHRSLRTFWQDLDQPPEPSVMLVADCRLQVESISWDTLSLQSALEPYGQGFPEPVFVTSGLTLGQFRRVGDNQIHLKLAFRDLPESVSPIWFRVGMVADKLASGTRYDVAYKLGSSTYRGETRIDMLVEDMRIAN